MSPVNARGPLQKKGKCQKLACSKVDIEHIWNIRKFNVEDHPVFNGLYTASSLEAQISSLKDISKKIISIPIENETVFTLLDFLFELYFTLPSNSSLRTPLLRILSTLADNDNTTVRTALVKYLHERIRAARFEYEDIMDMSTLLMGFFENSTLKFFIHDSFEDLILNFLETSLIECHQCLLEQVPPTKKLIIINCIHNCIRCSIVFIPKCSKNPSEKFVSISKKLLTEEQIPSDTRSNSGMLFVLLYKCINEDLNWDELIYGSQELGYLSQLCIFSGILNTMKSDELNVILKWKNLDTPLLKVLFERILEIEESNPADSNLILGVSRCVHLISKSLTSLPQLITENFLNIFLSYLWVHLEHYIDAVRYISSTTLSNITSIGKFEGKHFIFEIVTQEISKMPDEKRAKHNGIISLIGYVPVNDLLQNSPTLIESILNIAANSSSVDHVAMLFETMMKQHLKETYDTDSWLKLWIDPLLPALQRKQNSALEHILINAIKLYPDIIHYIVSLQTFNEGENLKNIGVVLVSLRTSRKYGLLKLTENNGKWKGLLSYDLLRKCISHSDVEIRMTSFSLLVESQKTSECFIKEELDLFKLIFSCNINNQCPAIRQRTLALIKKFLTRFDESYQSLQRTLVKNKNKITSKNDTDFQEFSVLKSYDEFKRWLLNFSIENIFPGANFSRRGTSLNILMLCQEFGFWNLDVFTEENAKVLLKCLLDPYEENKLLATSLLSVMPLNELLFIDKHYVNLYVKNAIEIASSIRPPDSISAAYFIGLLTSFPQLTDMIDEECFKNHSLEKICKENIPNLIAFICLSITLKQLEKELDVAKKSILKAASSAPMYGQLCVIRYILKGIEFRPLVSDVNWKNIIYNIVNTAFGCNEIVTCVVNNSSPEGHLPMDFTCDNKLLSEEEILCETPVTAQMVLLCSWRTVKEVSLLLGEIVEKISTYKESILLSEEEIVRIGDHLMQLLLETKHRGAFEQAYLGFCKLAGSLWRCSIGNLHGLPFKWLNDTLNLISTNSNLSATRRSAGIPFIVQGLVCSELHVGSSKCLEKALNVLFGILNSTEASTESRAHSLNILRALFRHSMLGEMVGPYVAQGVAVAVNGFNSDTWAERNSSTLLLSALMVRIFGVPRSRTEKINWKNKLTGRIFFQRYPQLYTELLKHLELSSNETLYPAIYPVLLILGRLYPSPLEGTDSNLQLNTFIPLVSNCASSSIFKTRTLAASAMVALISPHMYIDYINNVFKDIASSQSENQIHGLLLQVIKLFRHSSNLPEEYLLERGMSINKWISEIVNLLSNKKRSYLVKEVCLKIIINCLTNCCKYISLQNIKGIIIILEKALFKHEEGDNSQHELIGFNGFLVHTAVALFIISYSEKSINNLYVNLNKCFKYDMYEVFTTSLDFYSFILNKESYYDPDLNDVDPMEMNEDYFNNDFRDFLLNDVALSIDFVFKLKQHNHHEDLVKLLNTGKNLPLIYKSLLKENINVIAFFSTICSERPEILGSLVLQCISFYFQLNENALKLKEDDSEILCSLLRRYSSPESDYECRLSVASFMKNNFDYLSKYFTGINYLTLWTSYIHLISDDEADVRDLVYDILPSEILPTEILKTSLEFFFKDSRVSNLLKAAGLISWMIGNCAAEEETWDENDRVFDKGDCNTFSEELFISKTASIYLKELYESDPSILTSNLSEEIVVWISKECCLNKKYNTLQEIVRGFNEEVNTFCKKSNGIKPFRIMEIKKLILEEKVHFIEEAVHY